MQLFCLYTSHNLKINSYNKVLVIGIRILVWNFLCSDVRNKNIYIVEFSTLHLVMKDNNKYLNYQSIDGHTLLFFTIFCLRIISLNHAYKSIKKWTPLLKQENFRLDKSFSNSETYFSNSFMPQFLYI